LELIKILLWEFTIIAIVMTAITVSLGVKK